MYYILPQNRPRTDESKLNVRMCCGLFVIGIGITADISTETVDDSTETVDVSTETVGDSTETVDVSTETVDDSTEPVDVSTETVDVVSGTATKVNM